MLPTSLRVRRRGILYQQTPAQSTLLVHYSPSLLSWLDGSASKYRFLSSRAPAPAAVYESDVIVVTYGPISHEKNISRDNIRDQVFLPTRQSETLNTLIYSLLVPAC